MNVVWQRLAQTGWEQLIGAVRVTLRAYCERLGFQGNDADELFEEAFGRISKRIQPHPLSESQVTARFYALAVDTTLSLLCAHKSVRAARPNCFSTTPSLIVQKHRLLREIGKTVQSAFNELRGRATFRRRKMSRTYFDILALQRNWYLLHGAHPPRIHAGSRIAGLSDQGWCAPCSLPHCKPKTQAKSTLFPKICRRRRADVSHDYSRITVDHFAR
jgi:hypothetical protein